MSYKQTIEQLEQEIMERVNVVNSLRKLQGLGELSVVGNSRAESLQNGKVHNRRTRGTIGIRDAVLEFFKINPGPFTSSRLISEAKNSGAIFRNRSLKSILSLLAKEGQIKRISQGYYAGKTYSQN